KGFPCGNYTVAMVSWDDAAAVYIDGVLRWSCNSWSEVNSCSGAIGSFDLNADSVIEIRTAEHQGNSFTNMSLVYNTIPSSAPTAVSGNTSICPGSATTLTASGGIMGTLGIFQWGTGTVAGENIIGGETSASIAVIPAVTT